MGYKHPIEGRWHVACHALAEAVAAQAGTGCRMNVNRRMFSFTVRDKGVIARLAPRVGIRDKLMAAFREDQPNAHGAATELADGLGEEVERYHDDGWGRDWGFYCVPTEPGDAEHIAAVMRVMAAFLAAGAAPGRGRNA